VCCLGRYPLYSKYSRIFTNNPVTSFSFFMLNAILNSWLLCVQDQVTVSPAAGRRPASRLHSDQRGASADPSVHYLPHQSHLAGSPAISLHHQSHLAGSPAISLNHQSHLAGSPAISLHHQSHLAGSPVISRRADGQLPPGDLSPLSPSGADQRG
jgi:hypothetical protein